MQKCYCSMLHERCKRGSSKLKGVGHNPTAFHLMGTKQAGGMQLRRCRRARRGQQRRLVLDNWRAPGYGLPALDGGHQGRRPVPPCSTRATFCCRYDKSSPSACSLLGRVKLYPAHHQQHSRGQDKGVQDVHAGELPPDAGKHALDRNRALLARISTAPCGAGV